VRIAVATTLVLALSFLPSPASSQYTSRVGLSFEHGSAFDGYGFGLARPYASVGVGVVFGSDYDRWGYGSGYGYGGYRGSRYGGLRCADVWAVLDGPYYGVYQAGFYDDWFAFSDLYYDCVFNGPRWAYHRYHSYRDSYYYRPRYHRPRGIYVSITLVDPFWWGHHHPRVYPVYDPWGYNDPWGYYGRGWVVAGRGPRVRSAWGAPGPIYRRPSPIYVAGTTFKEDPQGGYGDTGTAGRTARPRNDPSVAPGVVAPQGTERGGAVRVGDGVQGPPRRTAGVGGDAVRAPETGGARRPSDPSGLVPGSDPRPEGAGAPSTTRRGEPSTAGGPLGNVPSTSRTRGEETARPSVPETTPARGREPAVPPASTQPDRGVRVPSGSGESTTDRGRPTTGAPSAVPTRPSSRAPQTGSSAPSEAPSSSSTRSRPAPEAIAVPRVQQPTVRGPASETRAAPSRPSDRATVRGGAPVPETRGSTSGSSTTRSIPEVRSEPSQSTQPDRVRSQPSRAVQPERSESGVPAPEGRGSTRSQPTPSARTAPAPRTQSVPSRSESPSTRSQPSTRPQQRPEPQTRSQPSSSARQPAPSRQVAPSREAAPRASQPAPSRSSEPQASPSSGSRSAPSAQPAPRRPGEEIR
jgi:hypothetical protein